MPDADQTPSPDAIKQRNDRSRAIALGLAAFVIVVFLVTILKLSGNIVGGAS